MKICVITGTRAEYGLMRWILQYIKEDSSLELQLVVTGMHLSPEFGLTYKSIEEDGFLINKKVETLLSSDTTVGISKSTGLGIISFTEVFSEIKPDLVLVLGDRFEILSAVIAAMISRIPIAHIHGGESTEGSIDESIRHSITKMSHLHFTATDIYRKRVIQMGENPDYVYNTGSPGLDNLKNLKLKSKKELYDFLNFDLKDNYFIITLHPVTLENNISEVYINNLIRALIKVESYKFIFTMSNADTDGRIITKKIKEFLFKNPKKGIFFDSMGQINYLSALKHSTIVIGNSSSGIIEAPSFKIPTINIGKRQDGRIKAKSIIDCNPSEKEITNSIKKGLDPEFRNILARIKNPYGNQGASKRICDIIKKTDLNNIIFKKFFNQ